MYIVAAKAGLGFAVILSILGVIQANSVAEPLLLFVTIGLIPGTNIELSPDLVLIVVGAALMLITALFFRRYNAFHAVINAVLPEYIRHRRADPDYQTLIPALGRLAEAGRTAMAAANGASTELYFWFRSFGRPVIAQSIASKRGLTSHLVRLDTWSEVKAVLRTRAEQASSALSAAAKYGAKVWDQGTQKARLLLVRFISS